MTFVTKKSKLHLNIKCVGVLFLGKPRVQNLSGPVSFEMCAASQDHCSSCVKKVDLINK